MPWVVQLTQQRWPPSGNIALHWPTAHTRHLVFYICISIHNSRKRSVERSLRGPVHCGSRGSAEWLDSMLTSHLIGHLGLQRDWFLPLHPHHQTRTTVTTRPRLLRAMQTRWIIFGKILRNWRWSFDYRASQILHILG